MAIPVFSLHVLFAALIGFISYALTTILAKRLRIIDVPNARSSHAVPVPRGGGLGIVAGFLLGVSLIQILGRTVPLRSDYFFSFLIALILIAGVSLCDDIKHRGLTVKLGVQLVAIALVMALGNVVDVLRFPWIGEVRAPLLLYPITFLWLLGMTNAYNFLDGLDGMAAATAVVVSWFFSYITFHEGSHFVYLVSLSLGAASLGFLFPNWAPARIFMGDVGSAFLGFTFALLAIIAARYDHGHTSLFVMPLLLFHFIFDALFTFVHRVVRGEQLAQGHRTHVYQLLNRLGLSHGKVSSIYACLAVAQGGAAAWMTRLPGDYRLFVFLPFLVVYLLIGFKVRQRAARAGLI